MAGPYVQFTELTSRGRSLAFNYGSLMLLNNMQECNFVRVVQLTKLPAPIRTLKAAFGQFTMHEAWATFLLLL